MNRLKDSFSRHRWPILIGLIAVLVRLGYLVQLSALPEFQVPMVDEKWHWEWAQSIVSGSFWGEGAYFRAPAYLYLLAFLSWVTSNSIFWAKLLQSLICFGTAWFIFDLAKYLFDQRAAIFAGTAYALYGTLVFYETAFLIPVLFLFFIMWGMTRYVKLFDSTNKSEWLITGLIFGLAAISRPNVLLVVPFLMLWKFWQTKTGKQSARFVLPLFIAIGMALAILPVTVRNLIVTGQPILISSQGGVNLYLGNNPTADGLTMMMPEVNLDESVSWRDFGVVTAKAAERESGKSLNDSEQSSFWTGKALGFIWEHPRKFFNLVWKKTTYLISGFENSDNADLYHQRSKSTLYSILLWENVLFFPFGLLLPFAVVGIVSLRKQFTKLVPLYIFLLAYIPSIVLFLVTARHRLSLVPILIIIAAGGLSKLISIERKSKLTLPLLVFVLSLLVVNQRYYDLNRDRSLFQVHFNEGIAAERLGDYERAEEEYKMGDFEFSYSAPLVNNLAHAQFRLGKYEESERNFRRALTLNPNYGRTYHNYALLKQKQGSLDSAQALYLSAIAAFENKPEDSSVLGLTFVNLAGVYELKNDIAAASIAFQRALAIHQFNPATHYKASAFVARQGNYVFSDSLFNDGLRLGEPKASDWYNHGLAALRSKQPRLGIERMQQAIAKDQTLYQAYFSIGAAYYELKMGRDSVLKYVNLCLSHNRSFEPAQRLKRTIK